MERASRRTILAGAVACFFLSGVAGLLYEVVWTRLLGLVFGHTVYAVTTVLAAFMGGLALGSLLLGRWADRFLRPLRAYALLEAAIGAYCATTPLLFEAVDALTISAYRAFQPSPAGALAFQFAVSAAVLLVPTTLMGATLPVLSRAVVEHARFAASRVGTLYAINTWGAVAGTVVTGFFLLPAIGLRATVALGVGLNLLVATVAFLLERLAPSPGDEATGVERRAEATAAGPALAPGLVALGLAAVGISGAASMAYEVAWTRTLSLVLGSSTYAFTAMLATFLVGLAGGALAVARLLRSRQLDLVTFGWLEVAIALTTAALLPVFGRMPGAALFLLGRMGVSHAAALSVQFGLSFAMMIIPTLLIGATFPVMVAAVGRGLDSLGRDVGLVYGANTIGTIVGSVTAGFFLIPSIGIQGTVHAAAAANLVAGLGLLLAASSGLGTRAWAGGTAAVFVALALALPRWDPKVMTSGVAVYAKDYLKDDDAFRDAQAAREVLFYSEGISTTVAVERTTEILGVRVNGKVDASNASDMPTQVLVGHLGALLHPAPRRAMIVGLASGVTVGAVAAHPFQSIEVAELEPAMVQVARFFERENRHALADPRVHVVIGDGRHLVTATTEPYDLIVSEPSNPWIAGIASLFTKDFYEIARSRLSRRGVMVQWLQGYNIFADDVRMVVRTFQEVFPHTSVWTAAPGDFILVGTPEPLRVDFGIIQERLARSAVLREDFDRYRWNGENLIARFQLEEEGARRFAAGAPLNTDDRPLLEFRAPLGLYGHSLEGIAAAMRASRVVERPDIVGLDARRLTGSDSRLRMARADWFLGWDGDAAYEIARAGAPESLGFDTRLERARLLFVLGEFDAAIPELAQLAVQRPGNQEVSRYLRAATAFRGRISPDKLREACVSACMQEGDTDSCHLALEQLEREIQINAASITSLNNYAGVLYQLGDLRGAAATLKRAIDVDHRSANAHFNLGLMLEKLGQPRDAAAEYRETLRLDPGFAAAQQRLAALGGAASPTAPGASDR